jgi:capsular polysaccharide biosynthesis protein
MAGSDDAWYESEESPRSAMIVEVQRIRRRTRTRPIPVLLLAAAITVGVTYKLATRKKPVEAEVVLLLTESSLSQKHNGLPVDELRAYVANVLLPDSKLLELVSRRDLYKNRTKLGDQYAIDELRSQIEIQIWKNSFLSYDEAEQHSARIGITVADLDPDQAYDLARDLATIVIQTAQDQRQQMTSQLSAQIGEMRDQLDERLQRLSRQSSEQEQAVLKARREGNEKLAQAIELSLATLWHEEKRAAKTLEEIAQSRDALADRISAAGLDMSVSVVEEHRPRASEHHGFVVAMIAFVIAIGSLLGSAVFFGAFDSRVHDADDVERLGLTVLGHLPGFQGDHVGSLAARGASRARVPSFIRWLSLR